MTTGISCEPYQCFYAPFISLEQTWL